MIFVAVQTTGITASPGKFLTILLRITSWAATNIDRLSNINVTKTVRIG